MLQAEKGPLGLAMMNIHYEKPFDYDAVAQLFAERYPQRMPLVDLVFDETLNWKNIKLMQYIFIIVL